MLTKADHLELALSVAKVRSTAALREALGHIAIQVEASSYSLMYFDTNAHATSTYNVNNVSPPLIGQYDDAELAKVDPAMQHLRLSSKPLAWDRSMYTTPLQRRIWERNADHDMGCGADIALHLSPGRHFVLGLTWAGADHTAMQALERVSLVQTLAVFAEPTARAIATLESSEVPSGALTSREVECLYWASRGNTDHVTASILRVSPRTVHSQIASAIRKLNASNRVQAAVIAHAAGYLDKPPVRSFD